jgi:hypothetical protein
MARGTRVSRRDLIKLGHGDPRRGLALVVARAVVATAGQDALGDVDVKVTNDIEHGVEVRVIPRGQRAVGLDL